MSIIEFLEARIAEDERVATLFIGSEIPPTEIYSEETGWFERLPSPTRVLAECQAKRAIVEVVSGWGHDYNDDDTWYSCGLATGYYDDEPGSGCADDSKHGRCTCGLAERQSKILVPLAAVYSDHPDYREEWRHA